MQLAEKLRLVYLADLCLLVPLDLVGFVDLSFDLLLELFLPLLRAEGECLPQSGDPFLYLGCRLLQLAQLYQGLSVNHVGFYVRVIKFYGPESVIILFLEEVLHFVTFGSIQVVRRVSIIYLLHNEYSRTYNSLSVIFNSLIVILP